MTLTLVNPPTARPVTLDEVKTHLRVEHTDHDAMIDQLIDAAIGHYDGRDGWLGRALVDQTWELRLDCFPACIEIPLPPLIEIVSVEYLNTAGVLTVLAEDQYQVELGGFRRALLAPALNTSWPGTQSVAGAVRIEFRAGYALASEDSPAVCLDGVPDPIISALKLMVELFYGLVPAQAPLLQATADLLAGPFRVWDTRI